MNIVLWILFQFSIEKEPILSSLNLCSGAFVGDALAEEASTSLADLAETGSLNERYLQKVYWWDGHVLWFPEVRVVITGRWFMNIRLYYVNGVGMLWRWRRVRIISTWTYRTGISSWLLSKHLLLIMTSCSFENVHIMFNSSISFVHNTSSWSLQSQTNKKLQPNYSILSKE